MTFVYFYKGRSHDASSSTIQQTFSPRGKQLLVEIIMAGYGLLTASQTDMNNLPDHTDLNNKAVDELMTMVKTLVTKPDEPLIIPTTFTVFPLLPKELRLKIWRLALPPGRQVYISNNSLVIPNYPAGDISTCEVIILEHQIPITMFINQESRKETMSIYRIVLPPSESLGFYEFDPVPLIFSPKRDTAIITPLSLHQLESREYFRHLERQSPGLMASIKKLKIFFWESAWPRRFFIDPTSFERYDNGRLVLRPRELADDESNYSDQLLKFSGLEHIDFVYGWTRRGQAPHREAKRVAFKQHMENFLEVRKYAFGGTAPTIRIAKAMLEENDSALPVA